jgi:hypothetical protein
MLTNQIIWLNLAAFLACYSPCRRPIYIEIELKESVNKVRNATTSLTLLLHTWLERALVLYMHGGFDCRYREEYKPRTFVEGTTTWKSKIFRSKRRSSLSIIQVVVSYTKVCMFYSTYKIICDYTTKFWCEQIWIKIASSKEVYILSHTLTKTFMIYRLPHQSFF